MLPGTPRTYQTGVTYRSIALIAGHSGLDSVSLVELFDVITDSLANMVTKHTYN